MNKFGNDLGDFFTKDGFNEDIRNLYLDYAKLFAKKEEVCDGEPSETVLKIEKLIIAEVNVNAVFEIMYLDMSMCLRLDCLNSDYADNACSECLIGDWFTQE